MPAMKLLKIPKHVDPTEHLAQQFVEHLCKCYAQCEAAARDAVESLQSGNDNDGEGTFNEWEFAGRVVLRLYFYNPETFVKLSRNRVTLKRIWKVSEAVRSLRETLDLPETAYHSIKNDLANRFL